MASKNILEITIQYCIFVFILSIAFAANRVQAQHNEESGWWENTKNRISAITEEGKWDIYLSGYAHHGRNTYSESRLRNLNEKAWGLGIGKTIRNQNGNDESIYGMTVRDSHRRTQWMVGYAYQWVFPVTDDGLEFGAGVSALMIRRSDWYDGIPFPALLPVFSFGTEDARLMATYVPRISTRKGKGDVLLLFAKLNF